jgi:hypothetical protein
MKDLGLSLTCSDAGSCVEYVLERMLPQRLPDEVELDFEEVEPSSWPGAWLGRGAKQSFSAFWEGSSLDYHKGALNLRNRELEFTLEEAQGWAQELDYQHMSLGPVPKAWLEGELGERYRPQSLAAGHMGMGWACALKGEGGHELIATREYLRQGPWVYRELPGDVSFLRFYDEGCEPQQAFERARAAHRYLLDGKILDWEGVEREWPGFYDSEQRAWVRTVFGQTLGPKELNALVWLKRRSGPTWISQQQVGPVERVKLVFLEPENARRHLASVAIRGLECWTIEGQGEVQLRR